MKRGKNATPTSIQPLSAAPQAGAVVRRPRLIRSVQRQSLARRTFLRGSLGGVSVALGLPLLDIMVNDSATALADGSALPLRFGVFHWGCGVAHSAWLPKKTGFDWSAPDSLQPFADLGLMPYVTLVTGTCHNRSSPGHIPALGIALSSSHDMRTNCKGLGTYRCKNHPEPSVDAIVAEAWQGMAPLDSIEVGICRAGPYRSVSSWKRGGAAKNAHEWSPERVYNRLFSGGVATGTAPTDTRLLEASIAFRKSLLDALKEDIGALKTRVWPQDRQRVEQHLEGFRAMERRIQSAVTTGPGCGEVAKPSGAFGSDKECPNKEAKSRVMSQLVATAFACDLTRVVSYEWSANQSQANYSREEINVSGGHHDLSHKGDTPEMRKITRFIMRNFAYLADQLHKQPDVDGKTVLDNTLLFGTSSHANADKHNYHDFPMIFAGKAGGRIKAGLHHRDSRPGNYRERNGAPPPNVNSPRVLLTAVRLVGVPLPKLGQPNSDGRRLATETISEIEA